MTPVMAEYRYTWFSHDATVNLPVVNRIHPQSNKFATGDSKRNDSPVLDWQFQSD